jgi:hypothetical protein
LKLQRSKDESIQVFSSKPLKFIKVIVEKKLRKTGRAAEFER